MRRTVGIALALSLALAAGAEAEEAGVVKARLKLDKVEPQLSVQPPRDVNSANKLIAEINKAVGYLKTAKNRSDPAWKKQAARSQEFDKAVRARLAGTDGKKVEADQFARSGAKSVAEVEAAFPKMAAGDVAEANRLIRQLVSASKTLTRSNAKGSEAWQEAARKMKELDAKVRARAAEKAKPGAKPAKRPVKRAASPSVPSGGGAAPARLGTDDNYKFRRDFADRFPGYQKELQQMNPRKLAAAHVVRGKKETAERMRKALKKLSPAAQKHPKLIEAYAKLDEYEKLVDERAAEGKRLAGQAEEAASAAEAAAEERLDEIRGTFDPSTYECELDPPWSPERVEEWAKGLRAAEASVKKAKAELATFIQENPGWKGHEKYTKLYAPLQRRTPAKIRNCIGDLVDWYTISATSKRRGKWPSLVENTQRTTAEKYRTEANLANDSWQDSTLRKLSEAIEAARALNAFAKGYHGRPDPEYIKAARDFVAVRKEIEAAMEKVLQETRMPEDKGGSGLKSIANSAISRAKWGDDYKRIVVNKGKTHHEEPMSESRIDGNVKRTWTWTEIWDEFQVCRAEQVEGDWRLVYYTIKKISKGGPWKKLGQWYVRARIVSRRILPEHIGG